jgi:3D (Asp-Asp-Asp) domain-containing protein
MNGVPFGSVWENVATGQRYVVKDRIGHSSQFDIWMGSCAHARGYGRRVITIRRVS